MQGTLIFYTGGDRTIKNLCNLQGLTAAQAEYNQYAPILMTSVDTDPKLCAAQRKAILRRLGVGNWKIFGAHGAPKDYCVT